MELLIKIFGVSLILATRSFLLNTVSVTSMNELAMLQMQNVDYIPALGQYYSIFNMLVSVSCAVLILWLSTMDFKKFRKKGGKSNE